MLYFIHVLVVFLALYQSLRWFRRALNPQVLFILSLATILFLDFIFRGYDDTILSYIDENELTRYQLLVLALFLCIWMVTAYIELKGNVLMASVADFFRSEPPSWQVLILFLSGVALCAGEILKRLSFSDWSFEAAFINSIGPRGSAPWHSARGNLGDSNFMSSLLSAIFPFSTLVFAYLFVCCRGAIRVLSALAFLFATALLIFEGSRTFVVLACGALGLFIASSPRFPRWLKISGVLTIAFGAAGIMSAMYTYRNVGFDQLLFTAQSDVEVTYHYDDSYYRALAALDISATTDSRWDALEFFKTVVVNPIPRAIWPGKPALLAEFWGAYKEEYVTITFLGELFAMFGPIGGFLAAGISGVLIYLMLARFSRYATSSAGLISYLTLVLYTYMVMRSLQNLTQFVYLPMFAMGLLWAIGFVERNLLLQPMVVRGEQGVGR
jgi:oligosaccharide repeat unit polymerase